jgi:hypothetical protein
MPEVPERPAVFELADFGGRARFSLRWYGPDVLLEATWWIGVFDETGELTRCATFLPRPMGIYPDDLIQWLESILSSEVANRLTQTALATHPETFGLPMPD